MSRFIYPLINLNKVPYGLCKFSVPIKWWLLHKTATHYVPSDPISGTSVDLIDSGYYAPIEFNIQGNTIQNGTPSPESPAPINSVGDNENLFDKDNANVIDGYIASNRIVTEATGEKIIYISCKPNTKYTLKKMLSKTQSSNRFRISCSSVEPVIGTVTDNLYSTSGGTTVTEYTYTTTATANYLLFYMYYTDPLTSFEDMLDSIKIEEGEVATPYSPYNMGSITIEKCNKNLYNSAGTYTFTSVSSTWYFIDGKTGAYGSDIGTKTELKAYVQNGKRYTISCNFSDSVLGSTLVYSDETAIVGLGTDTGYKKYSFTANRTDFVILRVRLNANQEFTISNVMLEERETATTYTPHQSTTYSIYTQAPMRAIGDVRDDFIKQAGKWYERHKIGESIFTGEESENWGYGASGETGINMLSTTISNMPSGNYQDGLCNYFVNQKSGKAKNTIRFGTTSSNVIYIYVDENDFADLTAWKTWLATHNTEVIYQLAEPTLTECTEKQVEQLEAITTDRLYQGGTSFYSEDVVPPYLEVQYYTAESEE